MSHIRFTFLLMAVMLASCGTPKTAAVTSEPGSVTFTVDDKVEPIESDHDLTVKGEDIARLRLCEIRVGHDELKVLKSSFEKDAFINFGEDAVYTMLCRAFAWHRPVVLSPDVIWTLIAQGFSHHVNEHPEAFRDKIVSHAGKMRLEVTALEDPFSENGDWDKYISGFVEQIDRNTKEDIAKLVAADFSTTGPLESLAAKVTLMETVKAYFEYDLFYISCGIPYIKLTGTPDDWRKVLSKTRKLSDYGMDWWVKELVPILEQFIKASEGKPDQAFWQDIVMTKRPGEIRGGLKGCGPRVKKGSVTFYDGWFLKLFPYSKDGRTPAKVAPHQRMISELSRVPVNFMVKDEAGNVLSEIKLEMMAGIVGAGEDPATKALTPKFGWLIYEAESEESIEKARKELQDFFRKPASPAGKKYQFEFSTPSAKAVL